MTGAAPARAPAVSVVVPSHNRPMRLLWLLNALEEQTLPEGTSFEVIVAHDSSDTQTEALLSDHPLAAAGVLRHLRFEPDSASPSAKRNAAWEAARAPLIAFTDDDCRPEAGWLAALLEAAAAQPGRVLQGTTRPDPLEDHLLELVRHARSQHIDPPNFYAQTCNIAYPRDTLERVGGFDELGPVPAGEDTDLWLRVEDAMGGAIAAVPGAVVYHAVEPMTFRQLLRFTRRWEHLALVIRRHPRLRSELTWRIFWKPRHPWFLLALAGVALAPRRPLAALLILPWLRLAVPAGGHSPRQLLARARRVPEHAILDYVEISTVARGSIRYRTLYL